MKNYVVIKFGSKARGDYDEKSDEDILCIYEGVINFNHLKKKYSQIVFYKKNDIMRMKNAGSLFLTHLDIDGVVVEGEISIIKIFSNYKPEREKIIKGIRDTKKYLSQITWYPRGGYGLGWLCDVIYVLIRNLIYLENALKGVYIFSYKKAINENEFFKNKMDVLMSIRSNKYLYRNGGGDLVMIEINKINDLIGLALNKSVNILNYGVSNFDESYGYLKERFFERAIINGEINYDNEFFDLLKEHRYNRCSINRKIEKGINWLRATKG